MAGLQPDHLNPLAGGAGSLRISPDLIAVSISQRRVSSSRIDASSDGARRGVPGSDGRPGGGSRGR
jgi:hypothetical protein